MVMLLFKSGSGLCRSIVPVTVKLIVNLSFALPASADKIAARSVPGPESASDVTTVPPSGEVASGRYGTQNSALRDQLCLDLSAIDYWNRLNNSRPRAGCPLETASASQKERNCSTDPNGGVVFPSRDETQICWGAGRSRLGMLADWSSEEFDGFFRSGEHCRRAGTFPPNRIPTP